MVMLELLVGLQVRVLAPGADTAAVCGWDAGRHRLRKMRGCLAARFVRRPALLHWWRLAFRLHALRTTPWHGGVMLRSIFVLALVSSALLVPLHADAQTTTFCPAGQGPGYTFGFADLQCS